jgi:methylthioribulose-1-phosphate dehydratase
LSLDFEQAATEIAALGAELHGRGWVPATSGNFSARLSGGDIAITASGKDKARLVPDDVIRVSAEGQPRFGGTPSAETGLHLQLYARDPAIGAVLHTHSLTSVHASMAAGRLIAMTGLELLKAFPGIDSHEAELRIPVFDNDQDIAALAGAVEARMRAQGQGHAYLIRGHGIYTWAHDLRACLLHLEALEYLLRYYLGKDREHRHE